MKVRWSCYKHPRKWKPENLDYKREKCAFIKLQDNDSPPPFYIYINIYFWMSVHPILLLRNGTKRKMPLEYLNSVISLFSNRDIEAVPFLQELPEPDNVHSRSTVMRILHHVTGSWRTNWSFEDLCECFVVDFI